MKGKTANRSGDSYKSRKVGIDLCAASRSFLCIFCDNAAIKEEWDANRGGRGRINWTNR